MKLWLIRPVTGDAEKGAWSPWYDKCFGVIVRAETEDRAREMASTESGNEGSIVWFDAEQTACTELTADGGAEIIMRDFHAA